MQIPSRWRSQRGVTSWSQTMRCWACGSAKRLFVSLSPCTPEVLAHMPASVFRAWSHGSGPCQADWDESVRKVCMCESADVRLHLLQPRGIVWHVTPDPAPPGENMGAWGRLRFHPADVAVCDGRLHIDVFTSGPAFICLYKHLSGLGTPPLPPLPHTPNPVCVFSTRWGARVTSDPLLHYDWWDGPALSALPPPPLLYSDGHLTPPGAIY